MKTHSFKMTDVIYFFVFLSLAVCLFYVLLKLPEWIEAFNALSIAAEMPDMEYIAEN
jgi:hypothetical protein